MRDNCLVASLLIGLCACIAWAQQEEQAAEEQIPTEAIGLIGQAGNADDEIERLRLLRQARVVEGLSPQFCQDLDVVIEFNEAWAKGSNREGLSTGQPAKDAYLQFFVSKLWHRNLPQVASDSPVYPIWCMYRGRMLLWCMIGGGFPKEYQREGVELLSIAREAYPDNRLVRMYLGEPVPGWPKTYPSDPNAPDWANLQREQLEKLADVAYWWIDNRQLEDGSFGGGWGDDCEMWKFWPVLIIAFDDPKIATSEAWLANGMFEQPHMTKGFTSNMHDVQHCAEDTSDTITPMMHLRRDDPIWPERARFVAGLMRDLWTDTNQRGMLQFKGIWFNVDKVSDKPEYACDTVYHPKVVQSALLVWQRTGDPELGELFTDWMDTWVDATAREENGKPAGIIPGGIAWPTGEVAVGEQGNWWDLDRTLYDWPSFMLATTNTFLLTYHMTGEDKYLEPIRSMARIRAKHLGQPSAEDPKPGSAAWCAKRMNAGQSYFLKSLSKYRLLTGDDQFDDLLTSEASPYMRFRLDHDEEKLTEALLKNAEAFRINWPARTSEVRFTDRLGALGSAKMHKMPRPNTRLLYATTTGDPDNGLSYFPMNPVRWLTKPRELAALVTDSSPTSLAAKLYHFGDEPRAMAAELFLLKPGQYTLTLSTVGEDPAEVSKQEITVDSQVTAVSFELPPRQLCMLRVTGQ